MSPRWAETVPSLARLLADLPADRRRAIARVWGVEESGGSAAVYRRMTSAEAARAVRDRLDAKERLLFDTAVALRTADRGELRRRVPFGDDELDDLLAKLEGRGLIWPRVTRGEGSPARRQWFVASDLVNALARPIARPPGEAAVHAPPSLTPLDREPTTIRAFGQLPRLITSPRAESPTAPGTASALRDYARRCGVALGVWTETREPGPRYPAWLDLDDAGRARALARLWLVDDAAPGALPETVRGALWNTLRTLDREKWYNLDEVARRIAWEAGQTGSGRGFGRDQIQTAVVTLAWLGVARFAVDDRERASALSITAWGAEALR